MKTKILQFTLFIAAGLLVGFGIGYIQDLRQPKKYLEFNRKYQKAVFKNGKEALADLNGNILTAKMDRIFCNDREDTLLVFIKKDKRGYLNLKGMNVEIHPIYDYAWRFDRESGLAAVSLKGKIGFIDTHGNMKIPPMYPISFENLSADESFIFCKGTCIVPNKDKRGLITLKNELLLPTIYDDVSELSSNGQFRIVTSGDKYVLFDVKRREFPNPLNQNELSFTSNGIVVLENGPISNQYLLDWQLNKKGIIFDTVEHLFKDDFKKSKYDSYDDENPEGLPSGFSKFAIGSKYGIIDDLTGKIVCTPLFDDIGFYSTGIFKATLGDFELLVDKAGKAVN